MEVLRAPIVWPGNTKKPQPVAKKFVLIVHRVTTRTHQTCKRASSAHLVLHNLLRNKRRALNAAPVNSTMLPVRFVAKCVSIRRTLVAKEETAVASIAQLDGRPKTAVPNAPRAVRGRLALGVKIACPVNTVRVAIKMPLRVLIAPLVSVKVIQDKLRASHAAPVSSTMLRVLLVANCVSIRRTLVKREETAVASIAQPVGRPKTAVRNAWRAARARLVWAVKIAQWGLHEKQTTMRPNANDANQV